MPVEELSEDLSSDEIKEYAAQVAAEVQEERKSDAEIVAGNSPEPSRKASEKTELNETTAEDNSGESTEADSQGEESSDTKSAKWLTDEVMAEAATYGLDEADVAEFASREELDRAFALFDKTALNLGRKAMVEGEDDAPARNEKGQFVKKEEIEDLDESPNESQKEDRYEVQLDADLFDEEIIGEFTRLRDHYESRLEVLEAHFQESIVRAEEERFDNFVDSLGYADLFGKTGQESKEELERREDLLVAVKAQVIGLKELGRPAEMDERLIARVANMVFADEIGKKKIKQRTQKVSKQNRLRQGGSPTKPLPPSDDPREAAERLYKELEGA
jgi:hypothetical protein